jgi:hypothetical protein
MGFETSAVTKEAKEEITRGSCTFVCDHMWYHVTGPYPGQPSSKDPLCMAFPKFRSNFPFESVGCLYCSQLVLSPSLRRLRPGKSKKGLFPLLEHGPVCLIQSQRWMERSRQPYRQPALSYGHQLRKTTKIDAKLEERRRAALGFILRTIIEHSSRHCSVAVA